MAFKKYGYYLKGNKIAVIEQSDATSSGNSAIAHCTVDATNNTTKDTCEAAGGQWIPSSSSSTNTYSEYMSPTESVADGLEIQYAYSPIYSVNSNHHIDKNKFFINGWTVVDGYLTFLRKGSATAATADWTSATENAVTSGSAGDTGGQTLDYIVVQGSSRWNGLHQVKSAGDKGRLQTYTKVSESLVYITGGSSGIDFADTPAIAQEHSDEGHLAQLFSVGDYVWVENAGTFAHNGLYSVTALTQSATATSSKITVGEKYSVVEADDATNYATGIGNELVETASLANDTNDTGVILIQAYRDFAYILTDVDTLNDESDTIDLPRYQANAVVYYLKAKLAEDGGDMEMREFFMREFKRQLEKGVSALKRGPYMIQGFKEMRN